MEKSLGDDLYKAYRNENRLDAISILVGIIIGVTVTCILFLL